MNYQIDVARLSDEQKLFLENFEFGLKQFITRELNGLPNLGVTPTWYVRQRRQSFVEYEHNADFSINDSLLIQSKIEDYVAKKLKVDFSECTLLLSVNYRIRNNNEKTNVIISLK